MDRKWKNVIAAVIACSLQGTYGHSQDHKGWKDYLGGSDSAQYSSLTEINKSNVTGLQMQWFFPAGENNPEFGFNPIAIDDVMYVLGKKDAITAVDMKSGRALWSHDVGTDLMLGRGINYWEDKTRNDRRLIYSSDNCLREVNASNGEQITTFGKNGCVDLREGLGRDVNNIHLIQSFSPGRVFENLVILGSATGEEYGSPPGDLRAYDVKTGKQVWIFHTIPHPGEPGYETWPPDAWKTTGGANNWAGMTVDMKTGVLYASIGAPTYDFYGADRKGANLYSDSLLALDARTGKLLWHFQFVHHDLWDYDAVTSPKLVTLHHGGKTLEVVAQATKQGFLFVFDRTTGKPVWPIEERSVPKTDMHGEEASPTQPFPTSPPPFARQKFTAADINTYFEDPKEREQLVQMVSKARNEGLFTPPGLGDTVQMPGNAGGANWGGAAVDMSTGTLFVQSKDAPTMLRLEPKPPKVNLATLGSPIDQGKYVYATNCLKCHGAELHGQPPMIPSLEGAIQKYGTDHIRNVLQRGAPPMPAFNDLSTPEVDALLAYLANPGAAKTSKMEAAWATSGIDLKSIDSGPERYWSGYGYLISKSGMPDITPPWTTITAYDLNNGTIKYQISVGEFPSLVAKGIRHTGATLRGGIVVTAGGLIIAGTQEDHKLWIFDKDSGKILFQKELPAAPNGVPSVFEANGREYIVICAKSEKSHPVDVVDARNSPKETTTTTGTNSQGYYVFALPKKRTK